MRKYNENHTNNILLIVGTIIIALMMALLFWQQNILNNYKTLLEKTDTTVYSDTIYLDKVVKDSIPVVQTKTIYKLDTLWKVQGDSIIGEPQVITLVKKKSAIQ